jgi:hypothetical protein
MRLLNALILDKRIKYLHNESVLVILRASLSTAEVVVTAKIYISVSLYQRLKCTGMQ